MRPRIFHKGVSLTKRFKSELMRAAATVGRSRASRRCPAP